jgi:hypothetical protein
VSSWDLWGVVALGAFHGVNPAMGWLFAVSIGLQDRSRRALVSALPPIAVGHLAAVAAAVAAAGALREVVPLAALRVGAAAGLAVFAVWRFTTPHVHPRWVGLRLRPRELVLWSFLMSTAHGAGLMLLPFALATHAHEAGAPAALVAAHTAAMIAVAGACAVVVYEIVGVGVLRRGWVNVDRVWAYALAAGAAATLFV